jgi:hypothetical protein
MVELSVRLVLAGLLVFIAGFTGVPPFMPVMKLGLLQSAIGIFTYILDRKNLRLPAISALIACADAVMIEFALASVVKSPALETFGFLALVPILLAAARHNSNPFLMAPVASAGFVVSHMAHHNWTLANHNVLGYACTFLVVGCLAKPLSKSAPVIYEEVVVEKIIEPEFDFELIREFETNHEELRQNYRQLKDAYRDLDRKSRKDRVAAILAEANGGSHQSGFFSICEKVAEATNASGILLYTVASIGDHFVIRGAAGDVNESQLTESLAVSAKQAIALVRDQVDHLSQTMEPSKPTSNLVLQHEGKVIGVLTISARDRDQLFEALESLQPCTTLLSNLVMEEQRRESMKRRLTEVEVLYAVVSNAEGAGTRVETAARIARDFQSVLQLEHLSIYSIDDDEPRQLAVEGRELSLLGSMMFESGGGLVGWLNSGGPELMIADARTSSLLPSEAIVRSRVGSYVVIPISGEAGPVGFITAASGRIAGIDSTDVATLRSGAAELSRLFSRPEMPDLDEEGMLSPRRFIEAVGSTEGVMVTLIPLQYKEFEKKYGKPAMAHAMRTLSLRIRPYIPTGSLMCKHPDGLIMVYLRGTDRELASNWANDLAGKGLGSDLRTPDGTAKMPLQLRVKIASLSPQFNQFLVPAGA